MYNYLIKNKSLFLILLKNEIITKFRGSAFGLLWILLIPFLMILLYTFVFSIIFNAKWAISETGSNVEFALFMYSGLIFYNFFSEIISKSTTQLRSNINYIKKIIFPLELLVFVNVGSALFNFLINLLLLFLFNFYVFSEFNFNIFISILNFLPFVVLTIGITFFFTIASMVIRDLSYIVTILLTALMFLTPIFYSVDIVPDKFRMIINLNPLTIPINAVRELIFGNKIFYSDNYEIYILISMIIFISGLIFFIKTKKFLIDFQ